MPRLRIWYDVEFQPKRITKSRVVGLGSTGSEDELGGSKASEDRGLGDSPKSSVNESELGRGAQATSDHPGLQHPILCRPEQRGLLLHHDVDGDVPADRLEHVALVDERL